MAKLIKNKNTKDIIDFAFKVLVVLAFFVVHLLMAKRHEAWRDEAQCWVITKNLSFSEILSLLPSEGHPILWFLVLKVLHFVEFPYAYFCVFTTVLVTVAVALFVFEIKLPFITKLCVLASALFFYRNPIVSRTYALIVLLIILFMVFWNCRYEKPIIFGSLIALLLQSHVIFAGMGCGLLLIMGIKCVSNRFSSKRLLCGTLIGFLSLAALPFELVQHADTTSEVSLSTIDFTTIFSFETVKKAFYYTNFSLFESNSGILYLVGQFFIISCFVFSIFFSAYALIKKGKSDLFDGCIVSFASYLAGLLIISVLHAGTYQMRSTWFLGTSLFFLYTLSAYTEKYFRTGLYVIFSLFFLLSCGLVSKEALRDYRNPVYVDSLYFSKYVNNCIPQNSVLLVSESCSVPAAYSYLCEMRPDLMIYSIDRNAEYDFHRWGMTYPKLSEEEWEKVVNTFDDSLSVYYWNCGLEATAPDNILNPASLVFDDFSNGTTDGNQLFFVR